MRRTRLFSAGSILLLWAACGGQKALAQRGEAGIGGGGSFHMSRTVEGRTGTASAGFENGFVGGGWIAHDLYPHLGGEIRYLYEKSDLKLSAGGTKISFGGQAHAIHYDVLIYGSPPGSKTRPFLAVGGGVKGYKGTGAESAYQPLSEFALLTKTSDWKGLISVGGGVKIAVGNKVNLRVEFRDYITPFPEKVITPAPGAKIGGWIHNFLPIFGIGFQF